MKISQLQPAAEPVYSRLYEIHNEAELIYLMLLFVQEEC
jgi:hypothetical protein